mmetsp:Transcript_24258/g.77868  ORF Transcript_24258/g.77868 Transcript_24258/m.77868 type:complete len:265 (+) Transcript_24258:126-920(+)
MSSAHKMRTSAATADPIASVVDARGTWSAAARASEGSSAASALHKAEASPAPLASYSRALGAAVSAVYRTQRSVGLAGGSAHPSPSQLRSARATQRSASQASPAPEAVPPPSSRRLLASCDAASVECDSSRGVRSVACTICDGAALRSSVRSSSSLAPPATTVRSPGPQDRSIASQRPLASSGGGARRSTQGRPYASGGGGGLGTHSGAAKKSGNANPGALSSARSRAAHARACVPRRKAARMAARMILPDVVRWKALSPNGMT